MLNEIVTTAEVKSETPILKRLKEEFKRLGLTVEEVAVASGIAKGTLDNIMSGRTESMKDVHIQALWLAYPTLDFENILTGRERETPVVYLSKQGNVKIEFKE